MREHSATLLLAGACVRRPLGREARPGRHDNGPAGADRRGAIAR